MTLQKGNLGWILRFTLQFESCGEIFYSPYFRLESNIPPKFHPPVSRRKKLMFQSNLNLIQSDNLNIFLETVWSPSEKKMLAHSESFSFPVSLRKVWGNECAPEIWNWEGFFLLWWLPPAGLWHNLLCGPNCWTCCKMPLLLNWLGTWV